VAVPRSSRLDAKAEVPLTSRKEQFQRWPRGNLPSNRDG